MKSDETLLKTIIDYCRKIDECIEFFGKDEEDFVDNQIYQNSCAFDILQIGENVKLLSFGLVNENPDINWKGIAGFRNIIVHDYGRVLTKELWITITERIPELKESCERILFLLSENEQND